MFIPRNSYEVAVLACFERGSIENIEVVHLTHHIAGETLKTDCSDAHHTSIIHIVSAIFEIVYKVNYINPDTLIAHLSVPLVISWSTISRG